MKVLVCGGRDFDDYTRLKAFLDTHQITVLVHGGARGADTLAGIYANCYKNITCRVYYAEWSKYGNKAGFIRNQLMLDKEHPDLVIAFPGGKGTADMVKRATEQGYKVIKG